MKKPLQIYDLLSAEEQKLIEKYITVYGGIEGDGTHIVTSLNHVLRFWNQNKQFLCNLFGGKLILEKEIDIKTPEAILIENMESTFLVEEGPTSEFLRAYDNQFNPYCRFDYDLFDHMRYLTSAEALASNRYNDYSFTIPVPGKDRPINVTKGCKVIKILSKIAKEFNLPGFEEFRVAHSMVLNQKRFKGTLCLSIHPLDYMTMSDNNCRWDSCMSWRNEGEFRLGTVEMMNSSCVIVAYLKAEKDFSLFDYCGGNETWNNKRWRELFIVTPELMTSIKGYPYTDNSLREVVYDWLKELMQTSYPQYHFMPKQYELRNKFTVYIGDKKYHIDLVLHTFYNDLYGARPAYFSNQMLLREDSNYTLNVSGETSCMICGEDWSDRYDDWDAEFLTCPHCSGVMKCRECGDYVNEEDMVFLSNGAHMCRWCAEYYATFCDCCGELYDKDDVTEIYASHNDITDGHTIHVCPHCYDSAVLKSLVGEIEYKKRHAFNWNPVPQVKTKNFTDEGFELFGYFQYEIEEMKTDLASSEENN